MLFNTADGQSVTVYTNGHVAQHPSVMPHLHAALAQIHTDGRPFITQSVEFPFFVGFSECVVTTDKDEILYAVRKGRNLKSRFVLNREPEATKKVSVILKKVGPSYVLVTAYLGELAPPEVGSPILVSDEEKEWAAEFWATHALIYSYQDK